MRKRKDQVFLETWHGTPLKRLAFDMEDNFSAAPGYKAHIYKQTRSWNYLVAANSFSSEIFRSCFLYNGEMLEYGYPRNDILHRPDHQIQVLQHNLFQFPPGNVMNRADFPAIAVIAATVKICFASAPDLNHGAPTVPAS